MNRQERKTPPGGNPAARYSRKRLSSGFQRIVALAVLPLIDGESKKRIGGASAAYPTEHC
jgi:hypothetical protein